MRWVAAVFLIAVFAVFVALGAVESPTLNIHLSASPEALPADGVSTAVVTARFADSEGNPIRGRSLVFMLRRGQGRLIPISPLTNEDGIAKAEYLAGKLAETAVVEVSDLLSGVSSTVQIYLSISSSIEVTLVEPSKFTSNLFKTYVIANRYEMQVSAFPESIPADGISTSRVSVDLSLVDGRAAAGVPIVMEIKSGDGIIHQQQKLTDKEGKLEAFYQAGLQPGTVIIQVIEPTTGYYKVLEIIQYDSRPAKILITLKDKSGNIFSDAAIMPADGASVMEVIAKVVNQNDVPLPNFEVRFSLSNGNGALEVTQGTTNVMGEARSLYYAGTRVGKVTITAYLTSRPTE